MDKQKTILIILLFIGCLWSQTTSLFTEEQKILILGSVLSIVIIGMAIYIGLCVFKTIRAYKEFDKIKPAKYFVVTSNGELTNCGYKLIKKEFTASNNKKITYFIIDKEENS